MMAAHDERYDVGECDVESAFESLLVMVLVLLGDAAPTIYIFFP